MQAPDLGKLFFSRYYQECSQLIKVCVWSYAFLAFMLRSYFGVLGIGPCDVLFSFYNKS